MQGKSVYKVPEGKLLKVFLDFDEKINKVRLTGDFFLYPEEEKESIEECIIGKGFDREKLVEEINRVVEEKNIELFGLSPEAIVEGIFLAKKAIK